MSTCQEILERLTAALTRVSCSSKQKVGSPDTDKFLQKLRGARRLRAFRDEQRPFEGVVGGPWEFHTLL